MTCNVPASRVLRARTSVEEAVEVLWSSENASQSWAHRRTDTEKTEAQKEKARDIVRDRGRDRGKEREREATPERESE
eukprot:1107068-Rhodomonas_salina.3